jgi:hypothetical protein
MTASPAALIVQAYRQTHQRILAFAEKLSDEQLSWRAGPDGLPIAFHLWHAARWADHFQAAVPGMTEELRRRLGSSGQIWEGEGLAADWGFDSQELGYAATGMHMADDIALQLAFPRKDALVGYLQRAFAAAERAISAIDDQQFEQAEQPQPLTECVWSGSTVGHAVVVHLTHDNRHLGMMECLLGLQAGSGTATV